VWLLCLLFTAGTGGSRLVGPMAISAIVDSVRSTVTACESDPDGDCDATPEETSDSQAHADPEPAESWAIVDLQLALLAPEGTELSVLYFGKPRSSFSSPEPRPAERV
jgi:hypothetical protein